MGIALLLFLLSLFPNLGYYGEVETSVGARSPTGFWLVQARANMTYNPFLYSLSWMQGEGVLSDRTFTFVSYPTYVGGEFKFPLWRTPSELEDEAILRLVLSQMYNNLLYNIAVLLLIEFGKLRSLYFCLLGGIIGFPLGGIWGFPLEATIGSFIGFLTGILFILFVFPRLKKEGVLVEWWDSLWKTDEIPI